MTSNDYIKKMSVLLLKTVYFSFRGSHLKNGSFTTRMTVKNQLNHKKEKKKKRSTISLSILFMFLYPVLEFYHINELVPCNKV